MGICVALVIFNTGCLLYPLQQTCISGISGYSVRISALNTHYQWWSKAGGGPGYGHEMEKGYIFKILIGYLIGLIDIF